MPSAAVCVSLILLFHLSSMEADFVGDNIEIRCGISGTYSWPEWRKDTSTIIANQGFPDIHPDYSTRFSYAADNKTLIVRSVILSDGGSYVCTHSGGINSPQTINITVEATTTQPEIPDNVETCCEKITVTCIFFVLVILVLTVVIIKCSHILIGEHKRQKEKKKNGTPKDNDGQNKLVWVILIIAIVIFIAVSVWFIVMQATVEDCKEMKKSECNVHIGLLAFEVVGFVLGVGFVIYLFYKYRGSANKSNAEGLMLNPNPRNIDHHNCSTSTKNVQEPNQNATSI